MPHPRQQPTIYSGRFISSPHPAPNSALKIREGAVLVSVEGVIERVDWTVGSAEEARERFGFGEGKGEGEGEGQVVEVVSCAREGFWFPGFVGEFGFLFCSVLFYLPVLSCALELGRAVSGRWGLGRVFVRTMLFLLFLCSFGG